LIGALGHVLTSQIHRRFNPTRAVTTTQRRLKRLSDSGLVERFQFHRRDGGGVPMCYVINPQGLAIVRDARPLAVQHETDSLRTASPSSASDSRRRLREARRDVHVAGWALALECASSPSTAMLRGPEESVLSPPPSSSADGRTRLAPGDLRLPGGRVPHDFLRTDASGKLVELEHFDTVRPHAIVELSRPPETDADREDPGGSGSAPTTDVLVEFDDRLPSGTGAAKLERYDHFLTGWASQTSRYGRRCDAIAVVVFVCRDRARARECARRADSVLRACRAYAGEYPSEWEYPARERILFVSERDVHEGLLHAYGVPRLPPAVRVSVARGDPRAGEAAAEIRQTVGAGGRG